MITGILNITTLPLDLNLDPIESPGPQTVDVIVTTIAIPTLDHHCLITVITLSDGIVLPTRIAHRDPVVDQPLTFPSILHIRIENLMILQCLYTRAIKDVNVPKFLQDDLKLFNGIISDLFPLIKEEAIDYGILDEAIRRACRRDNLKDVDGFVTKCIQLYETTVVRHGLMLVGPTGSGKTKCYKVLAAAMTSLKGRPSVSGGNYEAVKYYILNPKSITMGQLYGEFDLLTHEWTDGILSSLIRVGAIATDNNKKWYMFDGPVDAVWIENMNTVLDDNKKLCLSSGEIIKMTEAMTMMFEVQDLAVASPATVSRCGMVYLEPSILGLKPFTECWLKKIPDVIKPFSEQLESLFDSFLEESIIFMRKSVKEIIASTDFNLTMSLLKLLDCFFQPFIPVEIGLLFPDEGLIYDYQLDDVGISNIEEEEDEDAVSEVGWVSWMDSSVEFTLVPDTSFCDVIVPTMNTIQMAYLLEMLLTNHKPVRVLNLKWGKSFSSAKCLLLNPAIISTLLKYQE
ncbi:UNVERIFIED_CONTAM: Dynein heavy chain 1, axonemal [Gekko kuhli]